MKNQLNERTYIEINGIRQGMILQSTDIENPVLLFLHGGPGSPEIAFTQEYPTGLENIFTVCWWEQRGSCISYSRDITKESMTIENMIADAIEVANYLRKRFAKEKVYVMGHSWGSVLGLLIAQQAPDIFHAYIGIGQVVNQSESERLAYTYMINEFRKSGNKKMLRRLEKFSIDKGNEISVEYLNARSDGMVKLGIGMLHNIRSMRDASMLVIRYKGYTCNEKVNYLKGNSFSIKCLLGFLMQNNFMEKVPELEIPIYVLQGKFDYQVSYVLAKKFLRSIKAPVKGFYTFHNSAHSPCFEEAEKMCHILREDVLQNKSDLADKLDI